MLSVETRQPSAVSSQQSAFLRGSVQTQNYNKTKWQISNIYICMYVCMRRSISKHIVSEYLPKMRNITKEGALRLTSISNTLLCNQIRLKRVTYTPTNVL